MLRAQAILKGHANFFPFDSFKNRDLVTKHAWDYPASSGGWSLDKNTKISSRLVALSQATQSHLEMYIYDELSS